MSNTTNRRPRHRPIAVIALLLLTLTGCSNNKNPPDTPSTASPVCDGKLSGSVFNSLVGDGGITSEDTSRFHPTTWKAYGYCFLDGEEHSVRISYLWKKTVRNGTSASPSPTSATSSRTADTFTVNSWTGSVVGHRAWIDIPCTAPGVWKKGEAMLEVEVQDMPAFRTFDAALRKDFATAATKATRYLAGDVFSC
ncbi:hypothetical protein [Streptomyces endophyticus]|uniref:Lipoprotein n=1 Tax=Streptomyces endophyticus TaxID=714166 RepID=A0ABU6FF92_9ACTN|nr:hypothetical protein [Streptomyces endophyticus]MEB8342697.1 hypothetical protein [Streptomyces endophyticus]